MSFELDEILNSMSLGQVPEKWLFYSYPSLAPLGGYVADLAKRLNYFKKWIETKAPNIYWISGFYFTHSFLTGVRQNFARKHKIPIDEIDFDFEFKDDPRNILSHEMSYAPVKDGAYIYGLYLEAARWDYCSI